MHHASGIQYGQGSMPNAHPQYNQTEISVPSTSSTTANLRQYRKKDPTGEKQQIHEPQVPETQGPVARVAPHTHYPRPEQFRYTQPYTEYALPYKDLAPTPVKYSEIVEPTHNLQGGVIHKQSKEKEYVEMCTMQQQQQMKPYQEAMKHTYPNMYPPKESHNFAPYMYNYKVPNQYPYRQYPNDAFPCLPEQQMYQMDHRMYQNQRIHHRSAPIPLQNFRGGSQSYPQNYYNKPNLQNHDPYRMNLYQNYKIPQHMDPMGSRTISPRRMYHENMQPYTQGRLGGYNPCGQLEYAQHYQNRRQMPSEYLQSPYPNGSQMVDLVGESTPKSSLKQYLETWNDDIPELQEAPKDRKDAESLYILDSTEIPTENIQQFIHLQVDKLPENIKGFLTTPQESVIREPQPKSVISQTKKFLDSQKLIGTDLDLLITEQNTVIVYNEDKKTSSVIIANKPEDEIPIGNDSLLPPEQILVFGNETQKNKEENEIKKEEIKPILEEKIKIEKPQPVLSLPSSIEEIITPKNEDKKLDESKKPNTISFAAKLPDLNDEEEKTPVALDLSIDSLEVALNLSENKPKSPEESSVIQKSNKPEEEKKEEIEESKKISEEILKETIELNGNQLEVEELAEIEEFCTNIINDSPQKCFEIEEDGKKNENEDKERKEEKVHSPKIKIIDDIIVKVGKKIEENENKEEIEETKINKDTEIKIKPDTEDIEIEEKKIEENILVKNEENIVIEENKAGDTLIKEINEVMILNESGEKEEIEEKIGENRVAVPEPSKSTELVIAETTSGLEETEDEKIEEQVSSDMKENLEPIESDAEKILIAQIFDRRNSVEEKEEGTKIEEKEEINIPKNDFEISPDITKQEEINKTYEELEKSLSEVHGEETEAEIENEIGNAVIVSGNYVLLQIGGEVIEVNVIGKKLVSVVPLTECTIITENNNTNIEKEEERIEEIVERIEEIEERIEVEERIEEVDEKMEERIEESVGEIEEIKPPEEFTFEEGGNETVVNEIEIEQNIEEEEEDRIKTDLITEIPINEETVIEEEKEERNLAENEEGDTISLEYENFTDISENGDENEESLKKIELSQNKNEESCKKTEEKIENKQTEERKVKNQESKSSRIEDRFKKIEAKMKKVAEMSKNRNEKRRKSLEIPKIIPEEEKSKKILDEESKNKEIEKDKRLIIMIKPEDELTISKHLKEKKKTKESKGIMKKKEIGEMKKTKENENTRFVSSKHNFSIQTKGRKEKVKIRTPDRNKKLVSLVEDSLPKQPPKILSVKTKAELKEKVEAKVEVEVTPIQVASIPKMDKPKIDPRRIPEKKSVLPPQDKINKEEPNKLTLEEYKKRSKVKQEEKKKVEETCWKNLSGSFEDDLPVSVLENSKIKYKEILASGKNEEIDALLLSRTRITEELMKNEERKKFNDNTYKVEYTLRRNEDPRLKGRNLETKSRDPRKYRTEESVYRIRNQNTDRRKSIEETIFFNKDGPPILHREESIENSNDSLDVGPPILEKEFFKNEETFSKNEVTCSKNEKIEENPKNKIPNVLERENRKEKYIEENQQKIFMGKNHEENYKCKAYNRYYKRRNSKIEENAEKEETKIEGKSKSPLKQQEENVLIPPQNKDDDDEEETNEETSSRSNVDHISKEIDNIFSSTFTPRRWKIRQNYGLHLDLDLLNPYPIKEQKQISKPIINLDEISNNLINKKEEKIDPNEFSIEAKPKVKSIIDLNELLPIQKKVETKPVKRIWRQPIDWESDEEKEIEETEMKKLDDVKKSLIEFEEIKPESLKDLSARCVAMQELKKSDCEEENKEEKKDLVVTNVIKSGLILNLLPKKNNIEEEEMKEGGLEEENSVLVCELSKISSNEENGNMLRDFEEKIEERRNEEILDGEIDVSALGCLEGNCGDEEVRNEEKEDGDVFEKESNPIEVICNLSSMKNSSNLPEEEEPENLYTKQENIPKPQNSNLPEISSISSIIKESIPNSTFHSSFEDEETNRNLQTKKEDQNDEEDRKMEETNRKPCEVLSVIQYSAKSKPIPKTIEENRFEAILQSEEDNEKEEKTKKATVQTCQNANRDSHRQGVIISVRDLAASCGEESAVKNIVVKNNLVKNESSVIKRVPNDRTILYAGSSNHSCDNNEEAETSSSKVIQLVQKEDLKENPSNLEDSSNEEGFLKAASALKVKRKRSSTSQDEGGWKKVRFNDDPQQIPNETKPKRRSIDDISRKLMNQRENKIYKTTPDPDDDKHIKLTIKRISKPKKKKRFKNLHDPDTDEEIKDYSIIEAGSVSGLPRLIIKRNVCDTNRDMQPIVRIERDPKLDSLAKKKRKN